MTETLLLPALGVVAALLAVLVPVVLLQGKSLRNEFKTQTESLRNEFNPQFATLTKAVAGNTEALAEVRRDLTTIGERVARIEGASAAPWLHMLSSLSAPWPAPHRSTPPTPQSETITPTTQP